MNEKLGTKYPLSIMTEVGVAVLRRFGLTAESNSRNSIEEMMPFADFLISGHAPVKQDEVFLNIASMDDHIRETSIKKYLAYVNEVTQFPKLKKSRVFGLRRCRNG